MGGFPDLSELAWVRSSVANCKFCDACKLTTQGEVRTHCNRDTGTLAVTIIFPSVVLPSSAPTRTSLIESHAFRSFTRAIAATSPTSVEAVGGVDIPLRRRCISLCNRGSISAKIFVHSNRINHLSRYEPCQA